jgi:hypothetical protein
MTGPFILCHETSKPERTNPHDSWFGSPLECLYRARLRPPGIILIHFPAAPLWKREPLILLCAGLKSCSQTKSIPLVALVQTRHRKLLEELHRVGVEFVKYVRKIPLDAVRIAKWIGGLGDDDRVEHQLAILCPYLHYASIHRDREATVCGAYLDRMVLGGRRLHELCLTENHLQCPYFLNPVAASRTAAISRDSNDLRNLSVELPQQQNLTKS